MRLALAIVIAAALSGCADKVSKEEQEAAKNTYVCLLDGERLLIRFDMGMARMLMPNGERISLYQIPATSGAGVRFSNGTLELRGKGIDLVLLDATTATQVALTDCAPYSGPKQ